MTTQHSQKKSKTEQNDRLWQGQNTPLKGWQWWRKASLRTWHLTQTPSDQEPTMGRVMRKVFPAAGAACAKVLKWPEPSKVCFVEPIEGQCVQSWGFPGGASGKEPTCQCRRHEMWSQSLSWEDPLEEGISPGKHSSVLAWRILWTEEHGGL